jgi:hypothetical protein
MAVIYVETPRDTRVREFLENHRGLQQFGQRDDDEVWDGRTACTHTCWQIITLLWTGTRLTLNQINRRAGMPKNARGSTGAPRGMRIEDQLEFVKRMNLPYVYKAGLAMSDILDLSRRGPIVYGTRYGSQPDWKGKRGADGRPNGYALRYGRTQFIGADDVRHAVVLGLVRDVTTAAGVRLRREVLRRDPNHGSPARPERPPYDIITPRQARREYEDIESVGGTRFAFVPRGGANL